MMIDQPQLPVSLWTQFRPVNNGCASTVKMPKSTVRSRFRPIAASCDCNFGPDEQFLVELHRGAGGHIDSWARWR